MSPLVRRADVPGQAYSVAPLDSPRRPIAVALLGPDGWQVAAGSRVVGRRLSQREATALMLTAAIQIGAGQ